MSISFTNEAENIAKHLSEVQANTNELKGLQSLSHILSRFNLPVSFS